MIQEESLRVLFDDDHYLKQSGVKADALQHYLTGGWQQFDPHPLFSTAYYLAKNPDVAENHTIPLIHWVQNGWREKRPFHELFDVNFYLNQIKDDSDIDALQHYLTGGWQQFDPHPLFSTAYYLAKNPDVAENHAIPLIHFLNSGGSQFRDHHPLFDPRKFNSLTNRRGIPLIEFLRSGGLIDTTRLFNSEWYLTQSSDARQSLDPPVVHWIKYGSTKGLSPISHPIAETLSDLLSHDPLAASLLAATQMPDSNSSDAPRVLPFLVESVRRTSDSLQSFSDVYVLGDLPGVLSTDGLLFTSIECEPHSIRNRFGFTIMRGHNGLTTGLLKRPNIDEAIVIDGRGAGESSWFLNVMPRLLQCVTHHPTVPVITNFQGIRPICRQLAQIALPNNELIFLDSGEIYHLELSYLLVDSNDLVVPTSVDHASSDAELNILLVDPDDDLEGFSFESITELLIAGKLLVMDLSWPPELIQWAVGRARQVYASRALPIALHLAPQTCAVIACQQGRAVDLRTVTTTVLSESLGLYELNSSFPQLDAELIRQSLTN